MFRPRFQLTNKTVKALMAIRMRVVTSRDVARFFKSAPRRAATLCAVWVKEGCLTIENPSTKARSYRLADRYEAVVASPSPTRL
jgi:hypothetical protein